MLLFIIKVNNGLDRTCTRIRDFEDRCFSVKLLSQNKYEVTPKCLWRDLHPQLQILSLAVILVYLQWQKIKDYCKRGAG